MIKKSLLVAANSKRIEQLVSANRHTSLLVSRYVAGTTLDHAIAATKDLNAKGIGVSLDLLGETVSELAESTVATQAYVEAIHRIATDVPGCDGIGETVPTGHRTGSRGVPRQSEDPAGRGS